MKKIPEELIEEIKEKVSIFDVISEYVALQKKGSRLWGLCPFHNEKTPSFSVDDQKGLYYCYGCHKGGSIFTFVMEMETIGFIDAVRKLAEKAQITLPEDNDEGSVKIIRERDALYDLHDRLAESLHYVLYHASHAEHVRKYLQVRHIPEQIQKDFLLGYVPNNGRWLYEFLKKKNYSDDFLTRTGLFSKKYPQFSIFTGRLMIPITDHRGRTAAFAGRAMKDTKFAKYINSPETEIFRKRSVLFGMHAALPVIRREKRAVLCEGYFDVMALHAAEIRTAVAPMGTALTKEHAQFLKRYCSEITIVFDQDGAGIDAALKAMPVLEEYDFSITVAVLPEGKDPADLLQQNDLETLKKCLNFTRNGFKYLVETLIKRYDTNLPEGKESVFQHVLPCIYAASSEIKKNEYLRSVAEVLGLDEHVIYDDFNRRKRSAKGRTTAEYRSAGGGDSYKAETVISISSNPELYLLSALYYAPSLFKKYRSLMPYELFADRTAKELYTNLEDAYREGIKDIDIIISRLENTDIQNFIVKELESDKYRDNTEKIISDGIAKLRSENLIRKRKDIVKRIHTLETYQDTGSVKTVQELLFEKKYLDEEIEKIRNTV